MGSRHHRRDEPHCAIVVNATSAGLDALPFDHARSLARAASSTSATARVRLTSSPQHWKPVIAPATAFEMLLQQGLLSFQIWTGKLAPAGAVRSALLRAIEA